MSWGRPDKLSEHLLKALLTPAAYAYQLGTYGRLLAYGQGHLNRLELPVPVLSIGNITCGGTGKTPLTIDIARRLCAAKRKVCVLSRGYKRQSTGSVVVVNDGFGTLVNASDAGDEPYLISKSVPEAAVIVGADRTQTGMMAVDDLKSDVILLDDGFQHFRLIRDYDVVLLDYNDEPEQDALLPAGRLREPLCALGRAASVVVTKVPKEPDQKRLQYFENLVRRYNESADVTYCRFIPRRDSFVLRKLKGAKVVAFCGIARPASFTGLLGDLGADVVATRFFQDHYWYTQKDCELLSNDLAQSGADYIVTTQKDLVRLSSATNLAHKLLAIELETEWLGALPKPVTLLMESCTKPSTKTALSKSV